ncbi:MAG TPA: protein kinase [Terriglobia bacterium]|nr:protein kinase [Terriglobia bacterium]
MSFQIGDTLGDYQIIGVLGAGGMGKVYKVKNQISDRVDALKVLLPDLAEDPELADRFIREIKVLASLNHPNIAGLRTAFRLENQLLMVMEFVEGTTLDERTKAGPIPLEDAISYITQALAALGYAHKRGVIHRDIKPANMMLTPDNIIKLMDFGIAKSKSDKKLTQTGTTMGSLFYMSAEQVQGNELDGRSDLYSVGVSLYELVTGSRPFQGKSDFDIMIAQLQQTPMPPIQMMPDLPKPLNDIIMISLEKDPAKRFQTAEAFSAALGSITPALKSTPVQASAGAAFGRIPPAPPVPVSATGMMSTATTPAPPPPTQPMAVGGTISGPPPYIPTGNQPTLVPPQSAIPPVPSHGVPQPSASKGYRGLYMALGALIVLAILVVAGIQVPRYLKTHASGDQTAQMTSSATPSPAATSAPTPDTSTPPQTSAPSSTTASTSPSSGPNQAVAAFGAGNSTPPPAESGAVTGASSGLTPTGNPPNRSGQAPHITNKPAKNHAAPSNQAARGGQVASPPVPAGAGQVAPPPTENNDQSKQELAELADLHDKLSVRAVSVNEGVENLRKAMSARGNNLRLDISSSQTRMKMYMDKFDAAMNAGDPVAAKKYMSLAEHEVETLEKFLGH